MACCDNASKAEIKYAVAIILSPPPPLQCRELAKRGATNELIVGEAINALLF